LLPRALQESCEELRSALGRRYCRLNIKKPEKIRRRREMQGTRRDCRVVKRKALVKREGAAVHFRPANAAIIIVVDTIEG